MYLLETIWNDMRGGLGKEAYRLRTKAELAAFAKDQWEKVSNERLKALITTIP
jgi:hypothetical protein